MSTVDSGAAAKTLRVAIIGYGMAGSVFHAPLVSSVAGMEVAAIVPSNPRRQEHAQRDFPDARALSTADELCPHPSRYDLVGVAAPNRSHVSLGLAGINP